MDKLRSYALDNNGAAVGILVKDARKVLEALSHNGHGKDSINDILAMLSRADFKSGDNLPLINLI